ncbi:MAG: soluble lytic murein transglycosylase [Solirubrobacteraceae bacterium]|nr:soluble lytic murein transglycosylase [Solirubrobacteraceae bacterium]
MSARPATRSVITRTTGPAAARRRRRRRRLGVVLGFAALAALLAVVVVPRLPDAVRELALPLRHEDIIRQQSTAKGVDPSLVAAVIYTESKFRDQTSHAGARGLMQITPATARYIAKLSGGTAFEQGDLATPQINIAYGVYYLRYLLGRYDGNEVLALAAYNGGEGNVDRWISQASLSERGFGLQAIPFAETRDYVGRVLDVQKDYRRKYRRELGL